MPDGADRAAGADQQAGDEHRHVEAVRRQAAAAARGGDADDGDRDEPRDARDRVVHAGRDSGVAGPASESTVVVSGATVSVSPNAKPRSGGSRSSQ